MKRTEFLKLIKLDENLLKSLARRGQLPFAPEDTPDRTIGAYTLFEAFLTVLALEFGGDSGRMDRTSAAEIVAALPKELYRLWPEIGMGGKALHAGQRADEVICGRLTLGNHFDPLPFCTELKNFGGLLAEVIQRAPVLSISSLNATRAWALVLRRAEMIDLKIPADIYLIRNPDAAAKPVMRINSAAIYASLNARKPGGA